MIKEIETKACAPAEVRPSQTAATVQTTGRQFVMRTKIKPDPNQPRKEFTHLTELAASLKQDGFLEVLKVRQEKEHYVLIDGERRWRASEIAGIERVPIEIIEAKDVLKVQLLYGTQRENLNALEQAQTAQRLLEVRRQDNAKFSIEELGKELGLPRATVYELMALNKVSQPVREALLAGKLDASKARLFAAVPASDHTKLLKEALDGLNSWDDTPMSVRELEEHIEKSYSKQLKGAPFDQTIEYDVDGYTVKGEKGARLLTPCTKCPLRSGNIEGWLGNNPHVCTDVMCFGLKTKLFAETKLATAKARGQEIVPPEEYQRRSYEYAKASEKNYSDPNTRTWGQLAKAAGVTPHVTVDEKGAAIEVFTRGDKAAITNKLKPAPDAKDVQKTKELVATKKRREPLAKELLKSIQLGLVSISEADMMAFLFGWDFGVENAVSDCAGRASWSNQMDKLTPGQRRAALVMMVIEEARCNVQSDGEWGEEFADAAKLAGVDLKAEEKKATDAKETKPEKSERSQTAATTKKGKNK